MAGSKESSKRFFVFSNGGTSGPFTSEQLRNLAQSGRLLPNDQVAKESGDRWYPAHEVKGLFDAPATVSRQPAGIAAPSGGVQQPPAPQMVVLAPRKSNQNLGIASLCVAAVAICMCWLPAFGFALAAIGLVLGLAGFMSPSVRKGVGIGVPAAGSILSVVAFVPSAIFLILAARLSEGSHVASGESKEGESKPKQTAVETSDVIAVAAAKPMLDEVAPVVGVAKTSLETVIQNAIDSVVLIQGKSSHGTGFLVEPRVIATNRHVIAGEPIDALKVYLPKASKPFTAKLLYEDDLQDLAFLRVETNAKPLVLCAACTCRPGQEIVAIGNPGLGGLVLKNTISKGLMSSDITIEGHPFYQLNISINPGNSGGPILDSAGQVVGVTTLKAAQNEGVAFCIPASQVRAAFARAQTLSEQDIAVVEYKHRAMLTEERHSSTRETLASLQDNLVERYDVDPVLRGRWRLYATSEDRGITVKQIDGGLFAEASAKQVRLVGGKKLEINTVYVCHDDHGDPGNLVLFSSGVLWIVTKKPHQEYVVVQVAHVEERQIVETFRFLVTVEEGHDVAEPSPSLPSAAERQEQKRLAKERDERQLERKRKNEGAEAKFGSVLANAKESISKKRYASARANLRKIIKQAPGTDIARQAEMLLDSIGSSSRSRQQ